MAFLDNSGDIILDAVLTDAGRARLSRGDGSFKIAKYAFGDDEIDYSSYDPNHPSGSAYYDLEILQTPVFEAFTNNTSTMKSKLISLTNNNLLYLPVLKLNDVGSLYLPTTAASGFGASIHCVLVDSDTISNAKDADNTLPQGLLRGTVGAKGNRRIRVDQGLDTTEVSPSLVLDPELKETQYIIEIDSRFGKIYDIEGNATQAAKPSFIDDDSIASYYVTQNVGNYVADSFAGEIDSTNNTIDNDAEANEESISGPRGTNLRFGILSSIDLQSSDYLFDTIGSTLSTGGNTYKLIDSSVRVTGVTTGYRLDIPVRFLKYTA